MRATDRFQFELRQIEDLYRGSLLAYGRTCTHVQSAEEGAEGGERVEREVHWPVEGFADRAVADSPDHLVHKLRGRFPEQLREALIVRMVTTFENCLIELLRELFTQRRDLFAGKEDISIPAQFLLAQRRLSPILSLVISRDLRALTSGGLTKIRKYYRQQVGIDLAGHAAWPVAVEAVDRRHLIVHRMGRTDAKYRRDYSVSAFRVTVGRTYFANAFAAFDALIGYVDSHCEELTLRPKFASDVSATTVVEVSARALTRRGKAALRPAFAFESEEEIFQLGDLIQSSSKEEGVTRLQLAGPRRVLDSYRTVLRWLVRQGAIESLRAKVVRAPKTKGVTFTDSVLSAVAAAMGGSKVPPPGIKRKLSEQLDIPPAVIARAMEFLSYEPTEEQLRFVAGWVGSAPRGDRSFAALSKELQVSLLAARRILDVYNASRQETRERNQGQGQSEGHSGPVA